MVHEMSVYDAAARIVAHHHRALDMGGSGKSVNRKQPLYRQRFRELVDHPRDLRRTALSVFGKGAVFHAAWEARILAVTLALGATGNWNLDMSRSAREVLPDYLDLSYYLARGT